MLRGAVPAGASIAIACGGASPAAPAALFGQAEPESNRLIVVLVELTTSGVNVYVPQSIVMMDFSRHGHLGTSFGPLVNQLTPCPHHRSTNPKHLDKNFGLTLSIQDGMFGTLRVSEPDEGLPLGWGSEREECRSASGLCVLLLRKIGLLLRAERAEALPRAAASVQLGAAPLGITSRHRDHVA